MTHVFRDYAKGGKYSVRVVNEVKWIFPILVMFQPVALFWGLFDMQGKQTRLDPDKIQNIYF